MNNEPGYDVKVLSDLSNRTDDVIFAFQPSTNVLLYANPAFEQVWEMPMPVPGSDFTEIWATIHPEDVAHLTSIFTILQKEKQKQKVEFRIVLNGLKTKWLRMNAFMETYAGVETIIGSATDVTADKEYNENLGRFNDKKNTILQILSHDIVQPLGNIQIAGDLLSEQLEENSDKHLKTLLNMIVTNSSRGVELIRSFINKELLSSSQIQLVTQRADLVQKIADVIEEYERSQTPLKHRVHFVTGFATLYATVDVVKFMQVITNLLSNAIKFTKEDDIIEISLEDKGDKVLIKVQDQGIGIPAYLQPYLFERYSRAGRPGTHGEPSTGLGMFIIKTLIELHKGNIWFESKENVGTTFFVELPKEL